MFRISVRKSVLDILQREIITSGSVNIYTASFTFDSAWEGLERIAVFQIGTDAVSICLGEENCCTIPWEVLQAPNYILRVGVYGTRGGEVVLPTIWGELGRIREGVHLGGSAQPPTPGLIDQILAKIGNLEELDTSSKESLVAAVNELYAGGGGGGSGNVYSPEIKAIRVLDREDYDGLPDEQRRDAGILYFLRG